MENLLTITNREDLRSWLQSNTEQKKECWIDSIKKKDAVTYDNFMCFPELYRKIRTDTIVQVIKACKIISL